VINHEALLSFLTQNRADLEERLRAYQEDDEHDLVQFTEGEIHAMAAMRHLIDSGHFAVARPAKRDPKPHAAVRPDMPWTSWMAARQQNKTSTGALYQAIMLTLEKAGPSTDDELRARMASFLDKRGYSPESVTMRRGELRDAGWVMDAGERRPGDSGSLMTVWARVPDQSAE
jgi:hypothetical protein